MKPTHRPLTVAALLLSMFLAAMELTVVATVLPTVISDLGGIRLYSWAIAAYMLTSTVTVPIYGKLADVLGRKPVLLFGLSVFIAGSLGAGAAGSMTSLIVFRALQGVGAGAMQPIALTIVGDLFTYEERARMQGVFGAVWGVAGLAGPLLGGLVVKTLGWRWVFYINVPFALGAMALLGFALHENVEKRKHRLDLGGAALLTAGLVALLAANDLGGSWRWGLYAVAAGMLASFVALERRLAEPLVPLDIFALRPIWAASVAGTLVGAAMLGIVSYIPLYVQGILGGSPTDAGSAMAPMVVGWPIASAISGRLLTRVGPRPLVRFGLVFSALAAVAIALLLGPHTSLWGLRLGSALFGVGLGTANTALIITVQSSVDWNRRGVATASTMFFRTIGGTIAVGALGSLIARRLLDDPAVTPQAVNQILAPHATPLDPQLLASVHFALADALHTSFWVIAAISVAAAGAGFLFPHVELGGKRQAEAQAGAQEAGERA